MTHSIKIDTFHRDVCQTKKPFNNLSSVSFPDFKNISEMEKLTVTVKERIPSPISVISVSPHSTPGLHHEAPARLSSPVSVSKFTRQRSSSLDTTELDCFVRLEIKSDPEKCRLGDLNIMVEKADVGMKSGVEPILAEGAMGGAYFLRDRHRTITIVAKPGDEEPQAPNNPYQDGKLWGSSYKGGIVPGFGMYREVAAFLLDRGFSGVPPTQLARIRHDTLRKRDVLTGYKNCSVQLYVRHECSAEDMGPIKFDVEDVQRIAVFDVRICNLDRHEGNILVCQTNPYQLCGKSALLRRIGSSSNLPSVKRESKSLVPSSRYPRADSLDEDEAPQSFSCSAPPLTSPIARFSMNHDMKSSSPASLSFPDISMSSLASADVDVSPSPRKEGDVRQSPSTSSRDGLYRLVPIDHGFTLPHILHMSEASFAWLNWPQAKEPLSPDVLNFILDLDYETDAAFLRFHLGAAIPETSILTLGVCTMLLKKGALAGLTLFEMGCLLSEVDESMGKIPKTKVQQLVSKSLATVMEESLASSVHSARGTYFHRALPQRLSTSSSKCEEEESLQCALASDGGTSFLRAMDVEFDHLIDDVLQGRGQNERYG